MRQVILLSVSLFVADITCAPNVWYSPSSSNNTGVIPVWEIGSSQPLQWTTEWKTFSIYLTQNAAANSVGDFDSTILGYPTANVSSISEYVWNVTTNYDIRQELPFLLTLQDTEDHVHVIRSGTFNIVNPVSPSDSSSYSDVPLLSISSTIGTLVSDLTPSVVFTQTSIKITSATDPIITSTNISQTTSVLLTSTTKSVVTDKASSANPSVKIVSLELGIGIALPLMLILGIVTGLSLKRRRRVHSTPCDDDLVTPDAPVTAELSQLENLERPLELQSRHAAIEVPSHCQQRHELTGHAFTELPAPFQEI